MQHHLHFPWSLITLLLQLSILRARFHLPSQWAHTTPSRSALIQPATKFYWFSFLQFSHAQGSDPYLLGLQQRHVGSLPLTPPGQPCSQACFLLWLWFPCLESCSLWSIPQGQWDDRSRSLAILLIHDVTGPKGKKKICSLVCTPSSALCPLASCSTSYSLCLEVHHQSSYLGALTLLFPELGT